MYNGNVNVQNNNYSLSELSKAERTPEAGKTKFVVI